MCVQTGFLTRAEQVRCFAWRSRVASNQLRPQPLFFCFSFPCNDIRCCRRWGKNKKNKGEIKREELTKREQSHLRPWQEKNQRFRAQKCARIASRRDGMEEKSERIDQTKVGKHDSRAIDAEYQALLSLRLYVRRILKGNNGDDDQRPRLYTAVQSTWLYTLSVWVSAGFFHLFRRRPTV